MSPPPDIPIIGQPAQVLTWYPTALMGCKCQGNNMELVIVTGFGKPSQCPKCGKLFIINRVSEQGPGQFHINVDIQVPRAVGH